MSHDGCGCGHAHEQTTETVEPENPMAGGCCSSSDASASCGGGSCGSGGCGDGHAHGPQFDETETAVMQGFLSGVFATVLPRAQLVDYLTTMSKADGSEFQGPASFLLSALEATPAVEGKPAAISLVETVTGQTLDF